MPARITTAENYLGIWLSRMFLEHALLPLTPGFMVEVIGPPVALDEVEARDIRDTLERIISAAELLPMSSLEYLILVYSRVLFWRERRNFFRAMK